MEGAVACARHWNKSKTHDQKKINGKIARQKGKRVHDFRYD